MDIDTGNQTASAALAARERLGTLARGAAGNEHAMASVARTALFEEALLGALRAHFSELRAVAK
jgi:hypothetical protein